MWIVVQNTRIEYFQCESHYSKSNLIYTVLVTTSKTAPEKLVHCQHRNVDRLMNQIWRVIDRLAPSLLSSQAVFLLLVLPTVIDKHLDLGSESWEGTFKNIAWLHKYWPVSNLLSSSVPKRSLAWGSQWRWDGYGPMAVSIVFHHA